MAVASGTLYLITCAPSVVFGDGGEFQFVPYILGIAHPTGYPLYVILGWVWSHVLPLGDVAHRMNLFSALWAALAIGLSYPLALRAVREGAPRLSPGAARLAAASATATFAVGQAFWSQAVIAEVYSLNAFFVVLVLLLLLRLMDGPFRLGRGLALAVTYGFSLTHHRTMLLLLPGMLTFVWLARRQRRPGSTDRRTPSLARRASMGLGLAVGVVAPLLLYLYLPLRAPFVPYTTLKLSDTQTLTLYSNTWQGFVDHLTGSVFAESLSMPANQLTATVDWGKRLAMVWDMLPNQVGMVGIALALLGLLRLMIGRRWALLALTGLCYAVSVAFNMVYLIGDVHVLFIPSYLYVSLWLGLGVTTLAQGAAAVTARLSHQPVTLRRSADEDVILAPPEDERGSGVAHVTTALALALPVVLLVGSLSVVDQSRNMTAADTWQPILTQPIPPGAVLISNDRDEMMPLWYYQYVDGQRPDLLGLFPRIVDSPSYASVGGLIDQAMLSGRPVFLIKPMPGLEVKAQLKPSAQLPPLVEVAGPILEATIVHPRQLTLGEAMRLAGYDQSPPRVQPGDAITITLYWQPQQVVERDYTSYVHLLDENGEGTLQSDHVLGGDLYPTSLWRPGEVLRDVHVLSVPSTLEPGVYHLLVGMYHYPSMEALGGPLETGLLAVRGAATAPTIPPNSMQHVVQARFGGQVALLGYDWQLSPGGLDLMLYWQAERLTDQNWTISIQLLDETGTLVAQRDSQPQDGRYPTSVWEQGEVVEDRHRLELPAHLPESTYDVVVRLYSVESGERLPVLDASDNPAADNLPLLSLSFANGEWRGH